MEKFNRVLRGYDPEQVNSVLDKVISQVESMVNEMKQKDETIESYKNMEKEYQILKQKEAQFNSFIAKQQEYVNLYNSLKQKEKEYVALKQKEQEYNSIRSRYEQQVRMEDTLKKAIIMAERTSEQIKLTAHQERDIILSDARKNADRIVNEALIKSESIEKDANNLRRNVLVFKRRLREALQTQLELVDDIEKIDL